MSCPVRRARANSVLAVGQACICPGCKGCKEAHASLCAGARAWARQAVHDHLPGIVGSRCSAGALGQDVGRYGRVQPRGAERGYEGIGFTQVGRQQVVVLGRHGACCAWVASGLYRCHERMRQPDGQARALMAAGVVITSAKEYASGAAGHLRHCPNNCSPECTPRSPACSGGGRPTFAA